MERGDNLRRDRARGDGAVLLHQLELRPEDRLRRRRAETDQHRWLDRAQLRFEPWPAGFDLRSARLLVNPSFAAGLPLEVLHCIRDVDLIAWDTRIVERLIEQCPGRADERFALPILLIAR